MDGPITELFTNLWFAFGSSAERLYWLYLLTALFFAWISWKLYALPSPEGGGWKDFWRYCFPKGMYSSDSAKIDYFIFFLRPFFFVLLIVPLVVTVFTVSEMTQAGLQNLFGVRETVALGVWQLVLFSVAIFLTVDFAKYLMHYLMHKVWWLWEFHKIHHSAQVLIPFTAMRFHPVEDLLTYSIIGLLAGMVQGIFYWYWGAVEVQQYKLMGLEAGVFIFYLFAYNLRHTHIWLPYPKHISKFLISPAQHQIHHSKAQPHWDKNMGFVFAFWDGLFGTLYVPEKKEHIDFGLSGDEDVHYQTPSQVYGRPFMKIYRRYKRWASRKSSS